MSFASTPLINLSNPPSVSAISAAADWVNNLLFSPLLTAIGIIAIASIGLFLMLGRVEMKRAIWAVFGCFLVFGARGIAVGIMTFTTNSEAPIASAKIPDQPTFIRNQSNYDPYAGAAIETEFSR